jgi:hypothetical protein
VTPDPNLSESPSFAIDYGVRYLVEVITYDRPIIIYNLEQLVRQTILPFGLFFKMIGSNLKNCV